MSWDVRGAAPAGAQIGGLRPAAAERPIPRAFDTSPHAHRLDGALDGDLADLLCDLIERSWDQRTMRQ
ncbi:MAG: hypothetical protein M3P50_01285 [Actinomycetota bacterium]|nr:hypothetical protein [Actinomycetota bacterium]